MSDLTTPVEMTGRPAGYYVKLLGPVVAAWAGLALSVAYAFNAWANTFAEADRSNLREWLSESRVFRKPLPQLADEYLELLESAPPDPAAERLKAEEIETQLAVMAVPTRRYENQLPLFPRIYRLELRFYPAGTAGGPARTLAWESGLPRPPARQADSQVGLLEYPLIEPEDLRCIAVCDYQLHVFTRAREQERVKRLSFLAAVVVVGGAFGLAVYAGARSVRRELRAAQEARDAQRRELEHKSMLAEAERQRDEMERHVLNQRLEAEQARSRAAEAERSKAELTSQMYAGIGILAGSYAHNIKNLLVRPNDLLARCLEDGRLDPEEANRIGEVRQTLGTVTERLQMILRTVRRDSGRPEAAVLDLNRLVAEIQSAWAGMARERWQLDLEADLCPGPLWVRGDASHLQQAVENLLFNARDATFEMRTAVREQARGGGLDQSSRRKALIAAAGWRGSIILQTRLEAGNAVLEVRDNGIGMTEEAGRRCLEPHFSTKRDKAVYEGYTTGMGLGLSFVSLVLGQHGGTLEFDSRPRQGTTFRACVPLAEPPEES